MGNLYKEVLKCSRTHNLFLRHFYNDYFIIYSFCTMAYLYVSQIWLFICIENHYYVFLYFLFLSALCLVLLPFPSTRDTCSLQSADTVHANLRPFQFIDDILKDSGVVITNPSTWLALTKQQAFFQAFLISYY